jgi:AcrR family transcriptional regulator
MPREAKAGQGTPPPKRRDREVVDAAASVFYRKGYADASVQDVADEVGILKGSLYHYIDSKEDLLFRLLEEVHMEVQEILEEVAADADADALDQLLAYTRRQVEYNAENLPKISVYYHDVDRLSESRRSEIFSKRRVHEQFVADLIKRAQQDGTISDLADARLLGNCVFATIIWVYKWYRPQGQLSPKSLGELCASFVLRGIGASNPGS